MQAFGEEWPKGEQSSMREITMTPYEKAILGIEQSDLSPNVYRTARRLLDCVDPTFGHVRLSKDEIVAFASANAYNTARSHLVQLQRANVIHYSVNGDVYVNFAAWGRASDDHPRASHDHPRASDDQCKAEVKEERAPDDHPRAPHDQCKEIVRSQRASDDHPRAPHDQCDRETINLIARRSPTRATRSLPMYVC